MPNNGCADKAEMATSAIEKIIVCFFYFLSISSFTSFSA